MKFDSLLFNINLPTADPHQGSLLVAEPFLKDDYFLHAVICLIDYEGADSPAMGIVLNRQTAYSLQDLVENITVEEKIPIYCGGPVAYDRLYFLHTLGDILPGGREVRPGLWVGGDFDAMIDYINSGYPIEDRIRFFVGYSGWSKGQLSQEVEAHTWAVAEIESNDKLFTLSEDELWHDAVRSLGHEHRGWLFHPRNPHAN